MLITSAETIVNCTMMRIWAGIKLRIREMATLESAVTNVRPKDMTSAVFTWVVTASAEQIPKT
jgi:hypothetical protein